MSMAGSDVRDIEALERLHGGVLKLADNWEKTLQEIALSVQRADNYFGDQVPSYWRRQLDLAERELTQALDDLQQKQSAPRASDRRSALEAQKRVSRAKARVNLCRAKKTSAKALQIRVAQLCDEIRGPLADMTDHSDNQLPAAAAKLAVLVERLHQYTDSSQLPTSPPTDTTASEPPADVQSRDDDL